MVTVATPTTTRRSLVASGAAMTLFGILTRPASAAEFNYKLATGQDPTHPVNVRAQEAIDRIREATGGRLEIKLLPANQLGSDTDLLTQVRNGSVEFFNQSSSILANFVPVSGASTPGLLPATTQSGRPWTASLARTFARRSQKRPSCRSARFWDNGYRQITSSTREIKTPDDLKGFKIRVPPAPILTSLFRALDAGPAPINFNELYSALQTKVVNGRKTRCPSSRRHASMKCKRRAASRGMYGTATRFSATSGLSNACHRASATSSRASSIAPRQKSGRTSRSSARIAPAGADRKGSPVHRSEPGPIPRCVGEDELLQGLEEQVRRRGLGVPRESVWQAGVSRWVMPWTRKPKLRPSGRLARGETGRRASTPSSCQSSKFPRLRLSSLKLLYFSRKSSAATYSTHRLSGPMSWPASCFFGLLCLARCLLFSAASTCV